MRGETFIWYDTIRLIFHELDKHVSFIECDGGIILIFCFTLIGWKIAILFILVSVL